MHALLRGSKGKRMGRISERRNAASLHFAPGICFLSFVKENARSLNTAHKFIKNLNGKDFKNSKKLWMKQYLGTKLENVDQEVS